VKPLVLVCSCGCSGESALGSAVEAEAGTEASRAAAKKAKKVRFLSQTTTHTARPHFGYHQLPALVTHVDLCTPLAGEEEGTEGAGGGGYGGRHGSGR
jgi:hypothetical protein